MQEFNYQEALALCKKGSDDLVKSRRLKLFCEQKDINYNAVLQFIRSTKTRRYPKLIKTFLEALGFVVFVDTKTTFTFFLEKEDMLNEQEDRLH